MQRKSVSLLAVLVVLAGVGWLFWNPPIFWLNLTKQVEPTAAVGAKLVEQYECRSCHRIGGQGALKAPALDGILPNQSDPVQVTIRLWLRNPKAVKANTAMPNFHLSDTEIDAILIYLASLHQS
jgi:mono/diheme cytochrome c family protein